MKSLIVIGLLVMGWASVIAQSFEILDKQDSYQSGVSQTLRIPLRIRNTTDKAQFYVFKKVQDDLNTTQ